MMSLKKIILIGPAYPYRGGNSLFISYLYDVLKDKFQVKIYNYKLLYPALLFPGKTQFDKSEKIIKKVPNIRIINSISPFNWIRVAYKLKKENADLKRKSKETGKQFAKTKATILGAALYCVINYPDECRAKTGSKDFKISKIAECINDHIHNWFKDENPPAIDTMKKRIGEFLSSKE